MPFLFRCQECARLKRKHLKQIIKWAWTRRGFSSNTAGFGVIKSPRWLSWGVVTNGYRYAGSCQGDKKIKAKLMRLLKGQELGSNANQSWAVCFSCLQHSFLNCYACYAETYGAKVCDFWLVSKSIFFPKSFKHHWFAVLLLNCKTILAIPKSVLLSVITDL